MNKNVSYTVKHGICTGCGICEGACPTNSIKMTPQKGCFLPIINDLTCLKNKGCHRCIDICPGVGVDIVSIAKKKFNSKEIKRDLKIGYFLECFTGYSTDYDIRYHSASGGMVSQLLIFLLEKQYINGAIVTAFDNKNELMVKTFIAHTKEDILKAKSSKYAPVTLNNVIRDVKENEGKYIVVGLPCHIHGLRKYENLDSRFKEKIIGYFGIYCSSGRTFYLTEYIFNQFQINRSKLHYFAYRDNGCLGSLNAIEDNKQIQVPYQLYYNPLRSFFVPHRCLTCIDLYAELADISFGDIHIEPYSKDKVGINSLIIRNSKFYDWIKEAEEEGYIVIQHLEPSVLNKSQVILKHKKERNATILKIERILGYKVPQYDIVLVDPKPMISILSYLHTLIQQFIGKHKFLHPLIKILKKNPQIT